ncbi:endonuclease NucS domain-containing protein [Nocardia sp. CS682]|uniref:endonuclease NucS domain-containing protein n=1 Tax=Nocardia sp. CS682 TaxID=1047172 RepID=UPI001F10FAF8|nr:endonuclease NucS domain-containing protein [Nocardia sp. CS682]
MQIGLWRVDDVPRRVVPAKMPLEQRLEDIIENDPTMLGSDVMIIGRQVVTAYGSRIDLLAVDIDGGLHILELKRDRTPRDVVAQVLDYGSWAQTLSDDAVREIYLKYCGTNDTRGFDEAFATHFGTESAPDALNTSHSLTVVAGEMDDATERLVNYLATGYNVPINVMFFDYYEDDGRSYLARTWMLDRNTSAATGTTATSTRRQPQWNGQDWYVNFGEELSRNWDDARKYGFVSAGGGKWYSRSLRQVPIGGRVFAYIPKVGYVGLGEVVGEAQPADEATLTVDGTAVPFRSLELLAEYRHTPTQPVPDEDYREWVLPVRWHKTVTRDSAFRKPGLFANQNSACNLRNQFTIDEVTGFFDQA